MGDTGEVKAVNRGPPLLSDEHRRLEQLMDVLAAKLQDHENALAALTGEIRYVAAHVRAIAVLQAKAEL